MAEFSVVDVVSGGFCSGCGSCAAKSTDVSIAKRSHGVFEADFSNASSESLKVANSVCPFSDSSPDEDQMGRSIFSEECDQHSREIGYYKYLGAGAVTNSSLREQSSSGGLTTWVLQRLLELGLIDGVIHVGSTSPSDSDNLFSYSVSRSVEDLINSRKSKYYVTEVSGVLRSIKGDGKRYAFVGIPCFISAVRNLTRVDEDYQKQIVFFVGLVCGHLKSTRFSQLMAWQLGVAPDDLAEVDFRVKVKVGGAGRYHFGARSISTGEWTSAVAGSLYGGDWGHAFFQLKACDFCDDIFVESADIAFGDAWIPRYSGDWLGTNIVITRRTVLNDILVEGRNIGDIKLDDLSVQDLVLSQGGNFRHRREGLSLRLLDSSKNGERVPSKRVKPGSFKLSYWRRRIVRLRQLTASTSHTAFDRALQENNISEFMNQMLPLTDSVARAYRLMRLCSFRGFVGAVLRVLKLR